MVSHDHMLPTDVPDGVLKDVSGEGWAIKIANWFLREGGYQIKECEECQMKERTATMNRVISSDRLPRAKFCGGRSPVCCFDLGTRRTGSRRCKGEISLLALAQS
jgi:hypothetical protein